MTRFVLTSVVSVLTAAATAVVPPILPGLALPGEPVAKAEDDIATLADRIGKNAKGVGDKLGDADTGDATRRDQAQLKQDLDKLIDLLQNPPMPPPPMSGDSSQPPPPDGGGGGGGGQSNKPMGGGQSSQPTGGGSGQSQPRGGSPRTGGGRRERQPEPMPNKGGQQPMAAGGKPEENGQPTGASGQQAGGNQPNGGGKATPTLPLAETIAKDFWGHLPEAPRQRMMQFFREQYNSRYKDLLPDYFSTLAEKEKKGKP